MLTARSQFVLSVYIDPVCHELAERASRLLRKAIGQNSNWTNRIGLLDLMFQARAEDSCDWHLQGYRVEKRNCSVAEFAFLPQQNT